ncbi:hypothetical protein ACOMHN_006531 [Nucella lapillus]
MVNADIIYLNLWSAFVSGMLIVLMSVNRCLFVVVPLAARRIITYRLQDDVYKHIMELGILHNSPPSTKRGCRAGRLHRLWHGLPPAPWPCTRSQHHSVPSRNLHPLMVPPFLQPHPDLQSAVGNAPLSSKHPAQLPTTDCVLSIISPMGGQPSDAPALSPPSPLQQGGQSSNAPALSPPSPLSQGGQPIALALSSPSPPPQGGQPSDAPGLSPSSSTLLLTVITAIVLSCLVPLTCYLPGFLTFTVKWRIDSSANRSVAYVATSGWFPMDARRAILVVNLLFVIVKPVCLVTVSLCCSITIIHLRRAYRKRSEMTTTGKNEDKDDGNVRITRMLLFLCVTYSVLVLPEVCQAFVFLFVPEFYLYKKYHNTFIAINQMLTFTASCFNSAVNFFSFLVLSSRFRNTVRGLCRC